MELQIFSSKDYLTTNWSGGTTTQMYIYPQEAEYTKRNFDLRISSATVNMDKSQFTNLNGFDRILMTLDKSISLCHNNNAEIKLNPLIAHKFSGNDLTISKGKCRDFNIMLRQNSYASAKLSADKTDEFKLNSEYSQYFLYVYKGLYCISAEQNYDLTTGQLMHLKNIDHGKIQRLKDHSIILILGLK